MKLSATVKYYNDVTEETCKKKKKATEHGRPLICVLL